MKVVKLGFTFSLALVCVTCIKFDNVTIEPAARQLYDFKLGNPKTFGLMTTSSGNPVEIRDTIQLNSDQFSNQYHLDHQTTFDAERIPERVVHGKGTGVFGYFTVTHDVSNYTSADLFNGIGKKTPLVTRLSSSRASLGGTDLFSEFKGMAIKFYTNEGNLDLLCLSTPVYLYKDSEHFPSLVRAFRQNPRTFLQDYTSMWDLLTLRPDLIHNMLWVLSDYGSPNGYTTMDAFPIHTYELNNKKGERYYARFNFRTDQGLANLTVAQAAAIQGVDLDYFTRDLYNAVKRRQYPSWRLEMDILTLESLKKLDYDPFDVTRLWRNGTYNTVQIGRVTLNQNPDNMFASIEQSAFNPGNLVPGIPGPVDNLFKNRKVFYLDTQNYRLGRNHNKISVNLPKYAKTYVRDGKPPVRDNMNDVPNYYPNSFNGPIPYVDETRPKETLLVLQRHATDFQPPSDFYNNVLENEAQRQRLAEKLVLSMVSVTPPVQKRDVKFMYLIDQDLGRRVEVGLKAALLARATQSG